VTRILEGYSFVLKTDNGSLFITVVGTPTPLTANPAPGDPRAAAPQPGQPGVAAPGSRVGVAVEPNAGRRK
jgi:hypothetical protein